MTSLASLLDGNALPSDPLVSPYQMHSFGHASGFQANHVLILFVPKVTHCFGLGDPWIPEHCIRERLALLDLNAMLAQMLGKALEEVSG